MPAREAVPNFTCCALNSKNNGHLIPVFQIGNHATEHAFSGCVSHPPNADMSLKSAVIPGSNYGFLLLTVVFTEEPGRKGAPSGMRTHLIIPGHLGILLAGFPGRLSPHLSSPGLIYFAFFHVSHSQASHAHPFYCSFGHKGGLGWGQDHVMKGQAGGWALDCNKLCNLWSVSWPLWASVSSCEKGGRWFSQSLPHGHG